MYSPAPHEGQGKRAKYVSFPWFPLEAAVSNFNFGIFVKNNFRGRVNENK